MITIDETFSENIDHYVKTMRDFTITQFNTPNRIGVREKGWFNSDEGEKAYVTIDDLFNEDTISPIINNVKSPCGGIFLLCFIILLYIIMKMIIIITFVN